MSREEISMHTKNPFIITFGKKPIEYIHRPLQTEKIMEMFTGDPITNQIYIIRGPRGTGKTVLLSDIANQLESDPGWVVIRCAPTSDILQIIAEGLERKELENKVSVDTTLTIPPVLSVHVQKNQAAESARFRIEDILKRLSERGMKLLITIDEITNTPQMQDFSSNFQIWMGQNYPVFFLGTALFERIEELQNVPNLTFLYRAPKIDLLPLDLISVARSYQKTLDLSEGRSREMAQLTEGYSFAFQALGYIYWNAMPVDKIEDILPDYDAMLSNAAYSKMWQEMSEGDHRLCAAIADCPGNRVQDIRNKLGESSSNRFNQRRIRLKNRGLINTAERGRISFALPRFREFVQNTVSLYGLESE